MILCACVVELLHIKKRKKLKQVMIELVSCVTDDGVSLLGSSG